MNKTVAIAGLGAIGLPVARALDEGIVGLRLIGVASRNHVKARAKLADFQSEPPLLDFDELAEADIVVEAAPVPVFERIALPALQAGRIFVPASAGALLPRMHLAKLAIQAGPDYRSDRRSAWFGWHPRGLGRSGRKRLDRKPQAAHRPGRGAVPGQARDRRDGADRTASGL